MATHVGTRSNIARTHLAPMAAAASIAPAPISLAAMYARQHTLVRAHRLRSGPILASATRIPDQARAEHQHRTVRPLSHHSHL